MSIKRMKPLHPGEVLSEEFLLPLGLSQNRLALDIHVPARRINEIVHGKRRITADTALRLSKYFGNSAKFWLGLQDDFDIEEEKQNRVDILRRITELRKKEKLRHHNTR